MKRKKVIKIHGYPKHLNTKQDVLNILNEHPEYHAELKADLQRVCDESDTAEQVISSDTDPKTGEMINVKTTTVKKIKMRYMDLGFKNKAEVKTIIDQQ